MTTDNAPNIVGAVRLSWNHIGCFAHTLNLIAQKALEAVEPTRSKVKSIVEHFKRSSNALSKLNNMQETLGIQPPLALVQDVITRWNSTLHMFQRFLRLKTAIMSVLHDTNCDIVLTNADWTIVTECCDILNVFEEMTVELSSEKDVTVSKIYYLTQAMIQHCENWRNKVYSNTEITDLTFTLHTECQNRYVPTPGMFLGLV